jgi:hypothetical protein
MTIDSSPEENGWESYLDQLKAKWMEKIGSMSPWISQYFLDFEAQYSFRMRYRNNLIRVWFTKEDLQGPGGNCERQMGSVLLGNRRQGNPELWLQGNKGIVGLSQKS